MKWMTVAFSGWRAIDESLREQQKATATCRQIYLLLLFNYVKKFCLWGGGWKLVIKNFRGLHVDEVLCGKSFKLSNGHN